MVELPDRILLLICNWNAHQSLQKAGEQHLQLPSEVRPLKVECLGQLGPSVILKALEKGAAGVILVGCSPEECHYEFGSRLAAESFEEAQQLARLLGFREEQLQFHQVHAGDGGELVEAIRDSVRMIEDGAQQQP